MSIPSLIGLLVFTVMPVAGQVSQPAPSSFAEEDAVAEEEADVDDLAIEAAIRDRFAQSKISSNGFQVRVRDGVAYIEGTTNVIQHKGTATRLAKLAGAQRVENRIEISDQARQRARNTSRGEPRRVHVRRANQPRSEDRGERRQ